MSARHICQPRRVRDCDCASNVTERGQFAPCPFHFCVSALFSVCNLSRVAAVLARGVCVGGVGLVSLVLASAAAWSWWAVALRVRGRRLPVVVARLQHDSASGGTARSLSANMRIDGGRGLHAHTRARTTAAQHRCVELQRPVCCMRPPLRRRSAASRAQLDLLMLVAADAAQGVQRRTEVGVVSVATRQPCLLVVCVLSSDSASSTTAATDHDEAAKTGNEGSGQRESTRASRRTTTEQERRLGQR